MINCNLALQKPIADDLCGETCCCVDCRKVESCKEICTSVDEFETCEEAISEDGFRTYYETETTTYNDGTVRHGLFTVESNVKPLNFESVYLDANVECRYFDTKREAMEYLGR